MFKTLFERVMLLARSQSGQPRLEPISLQIACLAKERADSPAKFQQHDEQGAQVSSYRPQTEHPSAAARYSRIRLPPGLYAGNVSRQADV